MPEQVRITWYVKHQHTETFTPDEFTDWVRANFRDVEDPTDLDEAYNRLDERDWRSDEALYDLARDRNWVESSDAEIVDLTTEAADR